MADITMSLDDTLELDAIIEEWNDPNNIVEDSDNQFSMSGFQTNTRVLNPQNPGTHKIVVNGQELTVEVIDTSTIPSSDLTQYTQTGSSVSNVTATSFDGLTDYNDDTRLFNSNVTFPEKNHKITYDLYISNWSKFATLGLGLWSDTADQSLNDSGYIAGCWVGDNSQASSNGIEVFPIHGTSRSDQVNNAVAKLSTNITYTIDVIFDVDNSNLTIEVSDEGILGSVTVSIDPTISDLSTVYASQSIDASINNEGIIDYSITNFEIL